MRIHLNRRERAEMEHFLESIGAEYFDDSEDDVLMAA